MFCPNCGKENDPSVRHCASCGSFIPDFSSDAASDQAGSLNLSETPEASQPMSYQALSQEDLKDLNDNQSRYQEYSMSDVVAKKSKKKLQKKPRKSRRNLRSKPRLQKKKPKDKRKN